MAVSKSNVFHTYPFGTGGKSCQTQDSDLPSIVFRWNWSQIDMGHVWNGNMQYVLASWLQGAKQRKCPVWLLFLNSIPFRNNACQRKLWEFLNQKQAVCDLIPDDHTLKWSYIHIHNIIFIIVFFYIFEYNLIYQHPRSTSRSGSSDPKYPTLQHISWQSLQGFQSTSTRAGLATGLSTCWGPLKRRIPKWPLGFKWFQDSNGLYIYMNVYKCLSI